MNRKQKIYSGEEFILRNKDSLRSNQKSQQCLKHILLVNEQKHCHSCVHGRFQHDDVHAMACNFSKEIVWLEEAPTEISAILQKDVMTQYCNENFGSFS